jgi:nucleoside-diphosphate-sugar epimerase
MNVFLTGATGFLGAHFLRACLGRPGVSVALVRAKTRGEARRRLRRSLAVAAAAEPMADPLGADRFRAEIRVEIGDVLSADCGLEPDMLRDVAALRIEELWHFAASLAFEERRREMIFRQNVDGALNALELASKLGVRRFIYVSTAYTAGRREGIVPEALHSPLTFNNAYEETKCLAEHALVGAAASHGIDLRIVRPAIVVGHSRTLKPGGSETGLYGFVRTLHDLRRMLPSAATQVRLVGDPKTPIHLIPVDQLVRDMLSLSDSGFPAGPVYHLTPGRSIEAAVALEIVCRRLDAPGIRIEPASPDERTTLERMLDGYTEFYGGYLRDPKTFERSLPGARGVCPAELDGFVCEYLRLLRVERPDRRYDAPS